MPRSSVRRSALRVEPSSAPAPARVSSSFAVRCAVLGALFAVGASVASAQSILSSQLGAPAGALAGWSVDGGRDLDGDGVPDIVVGSPSADVGEQDNGMLRAWSGADSSLLWTLVGSAAGDRLGTHVRFVDDLDGDGVSDVITSTPFGTPPAQPALKWSGLLRAHSGATGALLWEKRGSTANQFFGWTCDAIGDLNGDGRPEIASGAPFFDFPIPLETDSGFLGIYDGATGAAIHLLYGSSAGDGFGAVVASIGDYDGDGVPDFAVGTPFSDANGTDSGKLAVFSGATKLKLVGWVGSPGLHMGASIAAAGDVDGDGFDDFAVGSPSTGPFASSVFMRRGGAGSVLWTHSGVAGDGFGTSVRPAGDVNHDGVCDVVVGAPLDGKGSVHVLSGRDGKTLWTKIPAFGDGQQFGQSAANAGDVDGDGWLDLVIGQPGFDSSSTDQGRSLLVRHVLEAAVSAWAPVGDAKLAMWGGGLALGEVMDLRVTKLTPNQTAWLIASPYDDPVWFKGGTLVPAIDLGLTIAFTASPTGELFIPGIPGGLYDGALWLQVVGHDPNLLGGFEISNAVSTPVSTS
ncbi:MAG: FG-GAP repeat protein [Planctomycetes bacterium]|nr:FG-GAP repeat protein [Planctomycetota bacterium]